MPGLTFFSEISLFFQVFFCLEGYKFCLLPRKRVAWWLDTGMLMLKAGKAAGRAQEGRRNHIEKCESEVVESIVKRDRKIVTRDA